MDKKLLTKIWITARYVKQEFEYAAKHGLTSEGLLTISESFSSLESFIEDILFPKKVYIEAKIQKLENSSWPESKIRVFFDKDILDKLLYSRPFKAKGIKYQTWDRLVDWEIRVEDPEDLPEGYIIDDEDPLLLTHYSVHGDGEKFSNHFIFHTQELHVYHDGEVRFTLRSNFGELFAELGSLQEIKEKLGF